LSLKLEIDCDYALCQHIW